MELYNKAFTSLTPQDFDKTLAVLSLLELLIVPILLRSSSKGVAADAVLEIKQQICGKEEQTNE